MNSNTAMIVGGSGQFGIILTKLLLKKNYKICITTRSVSRTKKKFNKTKKIKFIKINVLNKLQIKQAINKIKPNFIFYFAGLSSPNLSFKKPKETYLSNAIGCKNFLEVIYENNFDCKFLNSSSCEIFAKTNKLININSNKNPVSPYGRAKLEGHNYTKFFRERKKINAYNAIFFNTESFLRKRNYLIPKICLAAINAKKFKKKTSFGNLNAVREWNWCEEQLKYLLKFIKKKPQDFILSNGKFYSARQMLSFAFKYFDLNYKDYILINKKYLRKEDVNIKKSNFRLCLKRNNIKRKSLIFGEKLILKLIKFYLNAKKF